MRRTDEERILLLAPTPADAVVSRTILGDAGFECLVCPDPRSASEALTEGAGAMLLTEEALANSDTSYLFEAIRSQEPWSDTPVLLLARSGFETTGAGREIERLGNVTVLERPVRLISLLSALRTALRARRRQYELRSQIDDLHEVQDSLRRQSMRQRLLWEAAAVLLTTNEPDTMLGTLFARIAPHFGLDAYFNFMVNESGDGLRLESCMGVSEEQMQSMKRLEFGQAICGTAAVLRKPLVRSFIQSSNDPKVQLVKGFGIRAYACSPLVIEDRLLGTLSYASRTRDEFHPDEIEFLKTICYYVTVAYERVRFIRQLRETDRRKDEFLATLAHEMRNPLAPIRNGLQIMRLSGSDEAAVEQARGIMERQLSQMVRLIDDLLDVSRITRGKLDLRKERVELTDVLRNAIDTARPIIDAAGHELVVSTPPVPVYLDADPMRLAQVFSNLLNNAAKYMDRGGKMWLIAEHVGQQVIVRVKDDGIGIPPEAMPMIFDMFTQVDHSLEKAQGGLGIGLTLAKKLVEMHGGSVEAHSGGPGKGSEFIARLPTVGPALAPRESNGKRREGAQLVKSRILVADDNRDAAESLGMMLRLMGSEVRTVQDGQQAVDEAETFRPDMVILDIGMPRLNGYEAARRIRQERWGQSVLLIALTGWGQEEVQHRAREAGFDRHFTKPVNPAELEKLMTAFQKREVRPAASVEPKREPGTL
jgi:signal transduction histidine kinase/DNA-binding response OmpR family regulator